MPKRSFIIFGTEPKFRIKRLKYLKDKKNEIQYDILNSTYYKESWYCDHLRAPLIMYKWLYSRSIGRYTYTTLVYRRRPLLLWPKIWPEIYANLILYNLPQNWTQLVSIAWKPHNQILLRGRLRRDWYSPYFDRPLERSITCINYRTIITGHQIHGLMGSQPITGLDYILKLQNQYITFHL